MQRWSRAVALGVVVLTCGPRSTNVAEAFTMPATGSKRSVETGMRDSMTASTMTTMRRRSENLAPLFSIRTGGAGTPGMDDDKTGYGPELIQDPDASMSPEEWEAKYGEEVDTMVLYDEKVREVVNRWLWWVKSVDPRWALPKRLPFQSSMPCITRRTRPTTSYNTSQFVGPGAQTNRRHPCCQIHGRDGRGQEWGTAPAHCHGRQGSQGQGGQGT